MISHPEQRLQETQAKITAAINNEISAHQVQPGSVHFFNHKNNLISSVSLGGEVTIPKGTAKIVANGDLEINGDIDKSVVVIIPGSLKANSSLHFSHIIAGKDVTLLGEQIGAVESGGKVDIKGSSGSYIISKDSVNIGGNSFGEIISSGDIALGKDIINDVFAKGNVSAKSIHKDDPLRDNAKITVKADGNVNVTHEILGNVISGGNVTAESIRGDVTAEKGYVKASFIHPDAIIIAPKVYLPDRGVAPSCKIFMPVKPTIVQGDFKNFQPPPLEPPRTVADVTSISSEDKNKSQERN